VILLSVLNSTKSFNFHTILVVLVALLLIQLTLSAPVDEHDTEIAEIEVDAAQFGGCGGGCSCGCTIAMPSCRPCQSSCCRKPTPILLMPYPVMKPVIRPVPIFIKSCCSSTDQSCCNSGGSSCCNGSNNSCCNSG
jgi:hypothetical protein